MYGGKFWMVPENFVLPTGVKRKRAWAGMVLGDGKYIRPFRLLKAELLPQKIRNKFKLEWQPIMRKMEMTKGIVLPDNC